MANRHKSLYVVKHCTICIVFKIYIYAQSADKAGLFIELYINCKSETEIFWLQKNTLSMNINNDSLIMFKFSNHMLCNFDII